MGERPSDEAARRYTPEENLEFAIAQADQAREKVDLDTRAFGHLEAAISELQTAKALIGPGAFETDGQHCARCGAPATVGDTDYCDDCADDLEGQGLLPDGGQQETEVAHVPHSSADYDDMDYVDDRGIRIFDTDWTCPNCGDDGELMFRPGSKNTCATCFWVINGQYNDYILDDWPLKYRQAQRLLAERGDDWHGTPGSVATALRKHFDRPHEAEKAYSELVEGEAAPDGGTPGATLGDFA